MKRVKVLLAEGFEEIEALTVVDILRRGGVGVDTVSIGATREVIGTHQVTVVADEIFEKEAVEKADGIILPGGMPGAANLAADERVILALQHAFGQGKLTAAICAAPMVLGKSGILQGKQATCYPGFEPKLTGAIPRDQIVVKDGMIITSRGPATAMAFAFALLETLAGEETARQVKEGTLYELYGPNKN